MKYPSDNLGNLGEQVIYAYHPQGWLNTAINYSGYNYVQGTSYDAAGRVQLRTLGADVLRTDYVYFAWTTANGQRRLKRIMTGTPGAATSLQDLRYGDLSPEASWYDAVGNILTIKDYKAGGTQTQSFSYDNADRLLSAAASGGSGGIYSETYTYNGTTGNLSTKAGVNYTYLDGAHRHAVTHLNGVQKYWYDANGNMVSRIVGGQTYTLWYDPENRLVGVSGAATATFTYDGDGKRVKATVGGTTTVYIGNYTEWTGSASTMVKYIYAGGQPVAMRVGAGTTRYFLLSDHLGSTTVTANSSGAFYSELRYKAWGEIRYSSGTTPTTLRYTGQRQESSLGGIDGLYYYGARWLDPALGRWIQPDSLIPDPGNPIDLDRFAYARNNPVKYFDPSGHISCEKLGTEECDENGDYVDDQPPPVGQSAYPTRDSATPFEVGKEWLSGSGQRRHVFIDVDPFTELLRQHEHIQNVRELIAQRLSEGDYKSYQVDYDLGSLLGVPKYIGDYTTLATFGMTGNLAVTFLGSYELRYFVKSVDIQNGDAEILFYVYNESTLASATHPPVLGYTIFWENNITPFMNGLVREGPMSVVTQTFLWTETIPFP